MPSLSVGSRDIAKPQPLFTVTQGTSATTFTISGLNGDGGRLYRLVWHLSCVLGNAGFSFNGNAATKLVYHYAVNAIGVAGSSQASNFGVLSGDVRGETMLYLKSGVYRQAIGWWGYQYDPTPEMNRVSNMANWTTPTGNITNVALTSAANINAGSTCDVYDAGVSR